LRNFVSAAPIENACWTVTNGTAGMENQALGLAERLGFPIVAKRVRLAWPWNKLAPFHWGSPFSRLAAGSDPIAPPWPRIAIGVGRESIPLMAAIKKASGGQTLLVQCQDPRVPLTLFDLVIPPEHDGVSGPNIFPILGSPNRITPQKLADARTQFAERFRPLRAPRLAVLIGGNSKAYRFDSTAVGNLTRALVELSKTMGLMVTVSRRTGEENVARIAGALKDSDAYFWNGEGENPYLGMLGWADAFLVTADSVNMTCDAAVTGKPVHIFPLPGGSAKFDRFHQSLTARGISRPFRGRIEQWDYTPLDETGRAAKRIRELLDVCANATDMKAGASD
jgi:hypothetical protein